MLHFFDCRAHAAVKEVLPPRKSLRLQKKEAEILELPPEPRGTLIYEQVQKSVMSQFTQIHCCTLSLFSFFFLVLPLWVCYSL